MSDSISINGQEIPFALEAVEIHDGKVELDGLSINKPLSIRVEIDCDLKSLPGALREYVEKSMRVNEP